MNMSKFVSFILDWAHYQYKMIFKFRHIVPWLHNLDQIPNKSHNMKKHCTHNKGIL